MDSATREYLRHQIDRKQRETVSSETGDESFLQGIVSAAVARKKIHAGKPLKGTTVPLSVLRRIISAWGVTYDSAHARDAALASRIGLEIRRVTMLMAEEGYQDETTFDMADRIICAIDVRLWHTDDELYEVYQTIDLRLLDMTPEETVEYHRDKRRLYNQTYNKKRAAIAALKSNAPALPTNVMASEHTGISKTTVSRALKGKPGVSREVKEKLDKFYRSKGLKNMVPGL